MAEKRHTARNAAGTCFLVLVMFGFAFWLSSSLYFFFTSKEFGHDAGIFAYIGYAITQGKALYTEAWDNKGPLLYFIDALGILIHYRYGIYALELLTLFSSVLLLYKTANLFLPRFASAACAILSMLSLTKTLEGGNLSEEYAIPFTALAFYLIAKYLVNGYRLNRLEMILVGVCISAVFMLRMNILAFLGCAVLGVIVILLREKKFRELGVVILFAGMGFVLFTAPFAAYLIHKNALTTCINTVYLGVLGSFSHINPSDRINNVNNMVLALAPSGTFFIIVLFTAFFLPWLIRNKKEKKGGHDPFNSLCMISFFGLIATLFANGLSGADHKHYFMSFVPVMIMPCVWLAKHFLRFAQPEKLKKPFLKKHFASAACFALALLIGSSCILQTSIQTYWNLESAFEESEPSKTEKVYAYVAENSGPSDTVQVFGYAAAVSSYYGAKRIAASQYFYYANGRFSETAKKEFATKILADLETAMPKLIMFESTAKMNDFIDHCEAPEAWNAFITGNYTEKENDIGYIVYVRK